ncbi:imidazole glycerol phosphate synthase [Chloropicon primus]|uniref:Imidazole glycerol phosphate synthase hisHF n=1 Tax=Chloropicon primus TaxID=1764295 RepID=A0A5B8MY35_9CHLO|nr:imidazole glycerol phosphate synthase [Chloropicon primus]UPR04265.1 imidazole glycerol phosphate synthase [Chloropicon primus]|eukprot:QDZ25056.1 imidazole glycerol phosphate synthase [Chloropicon primus]
MRGKGCCGARGRTEGRTFPSRATARKEHQGTRRARCRASKGDKGEVWLLDYGAGNVRSIRNAIKYLGYTIRDVESPKDLGRAEVEKLVFPGVGAFGSAMGELNRRGYVEALREYIKSDRPFFGICIGMQVLYEGSEESDGVEGLGVLKGVVKKFDSAPGKPVPHIGWNTITVEKEKSLFIPKEDYQDARLYFVHSYHGVEAQPNFVNPTASSSSCDDQDWLLAQGKYYDDRFVAAVSNGSNVFATQFHPEKSGAVGLSLMDNFLSAGESQAARGQSLASATGDESGDLSLAKRVIACLDVRSNDNGDLVVTKGDQYDVREAKGEGGEGDGDVRNLGKPVELATKYFTWGADEVTFLNITGFRDFPLGDLPMLEVLKQTSEKVFVPLTVGGGIREFTDSEGKFYSSLDVASEYFQSGADKISIGSEAVHAAEDYFGGGKQLSGSTSIEQISEKYGKQAVVISIDPRRVYVKDPADCAPLKAVKTEILGPGGEEYCWWQCTVKGGREGRQIGAYEVALAVEALGAGEILLNCIDRDGTGDGFDLELVDLISSAVNIPVIASSGAGSSQHFIDVFRATNASAALAAGIFHREEVEIREIKAHMVESGIPTRSQD